MELHKSRRRLARAGRTRRPLDARAHAPHQDKHTRRDVQASCDAIGMRRGAAALAQHADGSRIGSEDGRGVLGDVRPRQAALHYDHRTALGRLRVGMWAEGCGLTGWHGGGGEATRGGKGRGRARKAAGSQTLGRKRRGAGDIGARSPRRRRRGGYRHWCVPPRVYSALRVGCWHVCVCVCAQGGTEGRGTGIGWIKETQRYGAKG